VPQTTYTENFDGVPAPNLPAGWLTSNSGGGTVFASVTSSADSAPNSVFTPNPIVVGGASLTSPAIPITASAAIVTFRHRYDTEHSFDGGAFEISINGGAFTDILAAGGRFIEGGYNTRLGAIAGNPVSDRPAWSGNSGGFVTAKVQLPAAAAGQNVNLRWLFGSDTNTAGTGWWIDNVQVASSFNCTPGNVKSRADFDGDGRTDLSVYRPSEGNWYLNRSTTGFGVVHWGISTDVPVPDDYDNDGKADTAVFRNGAWFVLQSATGTVTGVNFGTPGDIPQAGDYDGDGRADYAVFRPSSNVWYILASGGSTIINTFGTAGDIPVRGEYNGDGKTDIAVFRPSTNQWWILNSGFFVSVSTYTFGTSGDKPVPADYDGDNRDDIAIYRPSTGQWWSIKSSDGGVTLVTFGISTDIPVPGDYDGDGRDDQAIYRNGQWWLNRSTAGVTALNFGLATDTPIPAKYIP
jgi:hypothetical protein